MTTDLCIMSAVRGTVLLKFMPMSARWYSRLSRSGSPTLLVSPWQWWLSAANWPRPTLAG
eukprot:2309259-Heterocapsa_arctica.AAC.1